MIDGVAYDNIETEELARAEDRVKQVVGAPQFTARAKALMGMIRAYRAEPEDEGLYEGLYSQAQSLDMLYYHWDKALTQPEQPRNGLAAEAPDLVTHNDEQEWQLLQTENGHAASLLQEHYELEHPNWSERRETLTRYANAYTKAQNENESRDKRDPEYNENVKTAQYYGPSLRAMAADELFVEAAQSVRLGHALAGYLRTIEIAAVLLSRQNQPQPNHNTHIKESGPPR